MEIYLDVLADQSLLKMPAWIWPSNYKYRWKCGIFHMKHYKDVNVPSSFVAKLNFLTKGLIDQEKKSVQNETAVVRYLPFLSIVPLKETTSLRDANILYKLLINEEPCSQHTYVRVFGLSCDRNFFHKRHLYFDVALGRSSTT